MYCIPEQWCLEERVTYSGKRFRKRFKSFDFDVQACLTNDNSILFFFFRTWFSLFIQICEVFLFCFFPFRLWPCCAWFTSVFRMPHTNVAHHTGWIKWLITRPHLTIPGVVWFSRFMPDLFFMLSINQCIIVSASQIYLFGITRFHENWIDKVDSMTSYAL